MGEHLPVPDQDLPVLLPRDVDITGVGSPLTRLEDFVHVACPCCGREIPYGRMHQHAIQHVVKRWRRLTSPTDPKPSFRSIWYKRWYVDEYGFFHKVPREIQYGFPSMPAGF